MSELNLQGVQQYRDPVVENFLWPKGVPPRCGGGHFLCLLTGRSIRFTFEGDGEFTECFLSAEEHTRVTNHEATAFFMAVRWKPLRELNATTARQQYLRCWHVINA